MSSCSLKASTNTTEDGSDKAVADAAKCVPCSSLDASALLSREQAQAQQVKSLPLWTIEEKDDKTLYLSRSFVAKNFQCALDAITAMGAIAEREGHHPDFHLTNYRNVEVHMWTHKLRGITQNDVELCRMLDGEVDVVYSPKWFKEHPEAAATDASS